MKNESIAIIGGGIAGLTAGYLLSRKYNITMFEKSDRLGGNAYTHHTASGKPIDIAACVFSKAGHKRLYELLNRLGIETMDIPGYFASFHDLDRKKGIYLTPTLKGASSLLNPRHAMDFLSLFRGLKTAKRFLLEGRLENLTLEEVLNTIPQFNERNKTILLSTLCLLSSMRGTEVLRAPAEFFIGKLSTYPLLPPKSMNDLFMPKKKTETYVQALSSRYKDSVVLNANVAAVRRKNDEVEVVNNNRESQRFDKVVFSCNADQALQLLETPTSEERRLLGAWKYNDGELVVHSDYSQLPQKDLIGVYLFNYRYNDGRFDTSVTGRSSRRFLATQYPNFPIKSTLREFETTMRTPVFDFDSYRTIKQLPSLNGKNNTFYCGSHFGYGLHEDAVASAMNVAGELGAGH